MSKGPDHPHEPADTMSEHREAAPMSDGELFDLAVENKDGYAIMGGVESRWNERGYLTITRQAPDGTHAPVRIIQAPQIEQANRELFIDLAVLLDHKLHEIQKAFEASVDKIVDPLGDRAIKEGGVLLEAVRWCNGHRGAEADILVRRAKQNIWIEQTKNTLAGTPMQEALEAIRTRGREETETVKTQLDLLLTAMEQRIEAAVSGTGSSGGAYR